MHVEVSVVIPVYNSEHYLQKCIDSIIQQTLRDVEYIFVDDGSTDRSVEIIEQVMRKDGRIRLITQKNLYAGVARNNGMRIAAGKYIIFLDSDDFFELTMLEDAYECAEKNQTEITMFGYSLYDDKTHSTRKVSLPAFPDRVFSIEDVEEESFFSYFIPAPWNKLYLKSFLERYDLTFQTIKKCNDTYFTHMSAYYAKRIILLKKWMVYYRINNIESLQGNYNKNRECVVDFNLHIRAKLLERNLYYGVRRDTYLAYAKNVLCAYSTTADAEIDSIRNYYYHVKEKLIPGLFDSILDFQDSPLLTNIYEGTFETFLLYKCRELSKELQVLKNQMNHMMISKNSMDYRIGHIVLMLPRTIKGHLGHFINQE